MADSWFIRKPGLFAAVRVGAFDYSATLSTVARDGKVVTSGLLPIWCKGERIDEFEVAVEYPATFPEDFPEIKEIGGRIPPGIDRHVYKETGYACLEIPETLDEMVPDKTDIKSFLAGPVNDFFEQQIYFEVHGRFLKGHDHVHGVDPRIWHYFKLFPEAKGSSQKLYTVLDILLRNKIDRRLMCPFCDAKALRDCHLGYFLKGQEKITWKRANEIHSIMKMNLPSLQATVRL